MTPRVVPNTFAQTVWLYLQLSSTAMGIVCQQAERSRCNCPWRRSAWRCQWRCLPANTEAGMLHVLRHTQKRAFVWGSQNSSRWYEATRSRNQNPNCQAKPHYCISAPDKVGQRFNVASATFVRHPPCQIVCIIFIVYCIYSFMLYLSMHAISHIRTFNGNRISHF